MAITKEPFGKGKTEDVNLVSAITKCYLTSEHPAFSWDQGCTLFEKKAIKRAYFHYKRKDPFRQTSAVLKTDATVQNSAEEKNKTKCNWM